MIKLQRGTFAVSPIAPTEVNPVNFQPTHVNCLDPDWTWMTGMTHSAEMEVVLARGQFLDLVE